MAYTSPLIYITVADDLRKKIESSYFPGDKLPPERELAREYNINRLTLRNALKVLEKEKRIYKVRPKGTFIGKEPEDVKRTLQKTIGFLLVNRNSLDEFHSKTLVELEHFGQERAVNIMFLTVNSEKDVQSVVAPLIGKGVLDGIIVSGLLNPAVLKLLKRLGIPTVALGYLMYPDPIEQEFNRVVVDSVGYGHEATTYLLGLGHRDIALLNGPSYQWFFNITQGYMRALTEAGVQYREERVRKCEKDTMMHGYTAAKALVSSNCPTAIFAANDRLAEGAMHAAFDQGLKIPGDISIIGVGDYETAALTNPPLTTISIDRKTLSENVLELLFGMMQNKQRPPQTRFAPFRILERETCGKINSGEREVRAPTARLSV
ncbi:MAG: hypothetical protein A2268_00535 [Candidatus Raymondbacteria bacterium RifOxyA12_full_50_37]|uniref:HTH gntR-type domain-containing protein n=1 Tax=Candidatus Raymondbacteria bacterium RIFOXYD12_FULL_49_13 TaxID=1817890 RepID=A0A1F7F2V8_UNCRA|nr:MAG: hypothetical protein A2350_09020 [Candidatus Raymondbacteria bacterium RifOxyB12_full_50_8]OGJ91470.1 MAG: hypothetical protein A2268_00535 [Candidatus Raymondbacteria bacterium RifOxyA12_full_50_37]OGJ92800.1 MAG: hypothetical protein A2248_04585 [Candidatus Raymondbacteria bacterium RIFOXYA2_FULL_49_16]OGK01000.1 MAG: hypothetical protein A2519_17250 [Candidatus Raymondbacteria bacterium RIFOXYD12_FULL_49_13]OGP44576.1 MAG: hypothetical protein A2324_10380 [Candidatus Raymondbacteria 